MFTVSASVFVQEVASACSFSCWVYASAECFCLGAMLYVARSPDGQNGVAVACLCLRVRLVFRRAVMPPRVAKGLGPVAALTALLRPDGVCR